MRFCDHHPTIKSFLEILLALSIIALHTAYLITGITVLEVISNYLQAVLDPNIKPSI